MGALGSAFATAFDPLGDLSEDKPKPGPALPEETPGREQEDVQEAKEKTRARQRSQRGKSSTLLTGTAGSGSQTGAGRKRLLG